MSKRQMINSKILFNNTRSHFQDSSNKNYKLKQKKKLKNQRQNKSSNNNVETIFTKLIKYFKI